MFHKPPWWIKYWVKIIKNWAKLPSRKWVIIYAKLGAENTICRGFFTIAVLYFQVFFWKLSLHSSNFDSHLSVFFLHKVDQLLAALELMVAYVFGLWAVNPAFIDTFDTALCRIIIFRVCLDICMEYLDFLFMLHHI